MFPKVFGTFINNEFSSNLHLKDTLDNFARKRNRKSKTPAELAGINLDLGRNKTLGLIYVLRLLGLEGFMESEMILIKPSPKTQSPL